MKSVKSRRDPNASSSSNSSLSSSGGGDAAMSADLASFFECPVCFDYVLPPILQCQSGHLVCSSCRSKLTCCPTCRGSLGNIRNLAMEKVSVICAIFHNGSYINFNIKSFLSGSYKNRLRQMLNFHVSIQVTVAVHH